MLTITRRFTFDAAHCLERHKGKCSRYHGHTYILEVTVCGSILCSDTWDDQGFFIDLGDLKRVVCSELDSRWDHHDLNKTIDAYPTAERLIHHLWGIFDPLFREYGCILKHLKLHETPNSWVEYDGDDPVYDHRITLYKDQEKA
jgi:6-pyruvoyltetrahydropterin/6-carboxytetrahydropterin synthase